MHLTTVVSTLLTFKKIYIFLMSLYVYNVNFIDIYFPQHTNWKKCICAINDQDFFGWFGRRLMNISQGISYAPLSNREKFWKLSAVKLNSKLYLIIRQCWNRPLAISNYYYQPASNFNITGLSGSVILCSVHSNYILFTYLLPFPLSMLTGIWIEYN